jgi:hypothetical protein
VQCITSVIFMFFAAFAPAITFGGLIGAYTDNTMGISETLMAQCVCGVVWAVFAAQPMVIQAATGVRVCTHTPMCNARSTAHLRDKFVCNVHVIACGRADTARMDRRVAFGCVQSFTWVANSVKSYNLKAWP